MSLGPMEIGLIVLAIVLLFGAKKLPELARSIGRSARIFKSEVKEMRREDMVGRLGGEEFGVLLHADAAAACARAEAFRAALRESV